MLSTLDNVAYKLQPLGQDVASNPHLYMCLYQSPLIGSWIFFWLNFSWPPLMFIISLKLFLTAIQISSSVRESCIYHSLAPKSLLDSSAYRVKSQLVNVVHKFLQILIASHFFVLIEAWLWDWGSFHFVALPSPGAHSVSLDPCIQGQDENSNWKVTRGGLYGTCHCPWVPSGYNSAPWLKLRTASVEYFSLAEARKTIKMIWQISGEYSPHWWSVYRFVKGRSELLQKRQMLQQYWNSVAAS